MEQNPTTKKPGRPAKQHKKQQFSITMDPELYASLQEIAEEKQTSFSQLVTNIILESIQKRKEHPNEFIQKVKEKTD